MHLAHLGIAVFVVGVTMVNGYQAEKDVKMALGDRVTVGGYHFSFNGVQGGERAELRRGAGRLRSCGRTANSCAR